MDVRHFPQYYVDRRGYVVMGLPAADSPAAQAGPGAGAGSNGPIFKLTRSVGIESEEPVKLRIRRERSDFKLSTE
jgi:hypothetical protein